MHALHPRNLFALVCLLLLTASAAAATPANHDALMTDGEYRKAFEAYSTTDQEAGKRLDAQDFAAVQKVVQAEMAEWAEMEISAGSSDPIASLATRATRLKMKEIALGTIVPAISRARGQTYLVGV